MIISDLNYLEFVSEATAVEGGFFETDIVNISFNTVNTAGTFISSPFAYSNSAAAGAKAVANNDTCLPSYSFTKADTIAVTDLFGGSFSGSTSTAVINMPRLY
jgi:hypothetical protein